MSWLFFAAAALVIALDQFTKKIVTTTFLPGESRIVVPHIFFLTYVQNHKGAFGFFGGHPLLMAAVALVVVLVFYSWYRQDGASTATHLIFGLILGGAIGNIVDRLRFGYVVDFFDVHLQGTPYYWPVFNVADSAISIGIISLLLLIMFHDRRRKTVLQPASAGSLAAENAGSEGPALR
jgi:signal peptidase II